MKHPKPLAPMAPPLPPDPLLLAPLFVVGALLYTSVGHGGATFYLAVLTLAGFAIPELVTTVLVLNILAAGTAFLIFRQAGHLRLRLLFPFLVTSVPAAYLGGLYPFAGEAQRILLGIVLLMAAVRLLALPRPPQFFTIPAAGWPLFLGGPLLGVLLGFVAGATGIGGGIFLSPILLVLGWADVRQAGSVASAFIVFNSAAGLAAKASTTPIQRDLVLLLGASVMLGAVAGSFLGARRLPMRALQILLGVVLLVAGAKAFL